MFSLSSEGKALIQKEMSRYETKESAIIPSLYIAQKENKGWISDDVIRSLSQFMDIPEARINEVFKFYTMFNQQAVGQHHIQVCTNISCALNGGRELAKHVLKELKLEYNQVSEDNKYCVSHVECLGSCGTAPMMQINETYYENLTPESAMNIIRGLK
jgi:NADH-quinone oxidoreductase subunit E